MSRKRHRLTRAAAERVLDGLAHRAAPTHHHPVSELLSSAVPGPFPGETPGEQAAVAAFRATRDTAAITATPRPRVARLVALKVAAAAVVLGAGSVAVGVARTNIHPVSGGTAGAHPSPAHAVPAQGQPLPAVTAGPARPSDAPAPTATGPMPAATGPASSASPTTPQPQASTPLELCRAYLQLPHGKQHRALATPEFAPLVQAAGSIGVDKYCAALLDGGHTPGHQDGNAFRPSPAAPAARLIPARVKPSR